MRVVCYVNLIVLSALLSMLATMATMATALGTRSRPRAEMKQLTRMADANQEQEKPAVRLVRDLGFVRHFTGGGFGPGADILGRELGGGLGKAFGSGGGGRGGGGGDGGRSGGRGGVFGRALDGVRQFFGRQRFVNPGLFRPPFGFLG
ncbi:hypothetical protein ACLKA7_011430 [Drosophila subpalustris]